MEQKMSLREKQSLFAVCFAKLIIYSTTSLGFEVTINEVLRTQAQADANSASGAGIKNSLHLKKLAGDINIFKNGVWLTDKSDYFPLANYWKALNPLCRWGGDFSKPDADHFSIEHEGVK